MIDIIYYLYSFYFLYILLIFYYLFLFNYFLLIMVNNILDNYNNNYFFHYNIHSNIIYNSNIHIICISYDFKHNYFGLKKCYITNDKFIENK